MFEQVAIWTAVEGPFPLSIGVTSALVFTVPNAHGHVAN